MNSLGYVNPFLRSIVDRPQFPAEVMKMSPEEYGELLRSNGFSPKFVQHELRRFEEFKERSSPPEKVESVTEGPTVTPQYEAWARRKEKKRGAKTEA